jgi:hypothetical protein
MEFIDDSSGEPISARLEFTKSARKIARPKRLLFNDNQWLVERSLPLSLPNGEYEFSAKRGPEFSPIRGGFTIESKAKDIVSVEIPRSVDMHAEHWFSGDHLSSLPREILARWQAADAVDMVVSTALPSPNPSQTKTPPKPPKPRPNISKSDPEEAKVDMSEWIGLGLSTSTQLADWQHGAILFHAIPSESSPADTNPSDTPGPSEPPNSSITATAAFQLLEKAQKSDRIVPELIRIWDRDVPIVLATGSIRSIQLLSTYNRPSNDDRVSLAKDKGGKSLRGTVQITRGKERIASPLWAPIDAEDELRFKDFRGVGRLSEYLYWQMLETGLRLTATAGSDFATNETHLGYNRVYVHSDLRPTEQSWWQSIKLGRTMVTNGPLLRVSVNSLPPGSVQASYRGQPIPIDIVASLSVREPVDYLDVILNGETIYSAKLEDHYKRGEFPPLEINHSGWLVVRVVTAHQQGYRFATTAPFYFEFDGKPRISRKAVGFFEKWLLQSRAAIANSPLELDSVQPWLEKADEFWKLKSRESNAE